MLIVFHLAFAHLGGFSQIPHVKLFVDNSESEVIKYFDSLNNLKPNANYKIKRSTSDDGSLILTSDFAIADEKFYTCHSIMAKFLRVEGEEICISELIVGGNEFAQQNISFIKDNFNLKSAKHWEKLLYGIFKITATFKKENSDFYSVLYSIQNN